MIIRNSEECGKSELDLFTVPPTQTVMEEGRWDMVKPYSNFEHGTITFDIEGDNQCYIDLSQTELLVTCQILYQGTAITKLEDKPGGITTDLGFLGPVNNFMHSLFSQIQVKVGSTEVENTNSAYAYRAYIENLLCYDREAKETLLRNEMFIKDTAGNMDSTDKKKNEGLEKRCAVYNTQKGAFHMKGKLKCDLFNLNRYMLPQVNLQVILTRSTVPFCIMGDPKKITANDLTIKILETSLQVRRVKVSQSVALQHAMMLEKAAAKYPIKRVLMRAMNTPFKSMSFTVTGIHRGIMPSRVVVGFVENSAYSGSFDKNPFNFLNLSIKNLRLKVASQSLPYSDGVSSDFTNNRYVQAYDTLFQNVRNMGNDITYDDYKSGYTLYAFDLSPDLCNSEHFNLLKDGALELEVQCETAPETAFYTIFYLEFDNVIEITKERGVIFDFSIA